MATYKGGVIEHRAYARVGLLGNPSDVYNGRTISFSLFNFWASVRLERSANLLILPHPAHDPLQFDSLPHLSSCQVINKFQHNFFRRQIFGDDALGDVNIRMVEAARRVGAASKFTGSGGAVVVLCPQGPSQAKLLEDACKTAGFVFVPVKVMPPFLNEIGLKTMSTT